MLVRLCEMYVTQGNSHFRVLCPANVHLTGTTIYINVLTHTAIKVIHQQRYSSLLSRLLSLYVGMSVCMYVCTYVCKCVTFTYLRVFNLHDHWPNVRYYNARGILGTRLA
jgi:hypothetical protein